MESFVTIWNSSVSLDEVCQRTGKSRRKAVSLASAHRRDGKTMQFFPRPKNSKPRSALPGERFGRWTVVSLIDGSKRLCRCDCGTTKMVRAGPLSQGKSNGCKRCGSWKAGTGDPRNSYPEHKTWTGMRIRCKYPSTNRYADYGGRGIRVCERWDKSYLAFLEDMGRKPTPEHTIDRIDVNGNYEPGNCRWAPPEVQRANKRPSRPSRTYAGRPIEHLSACRICGRDRKPLRKGRCGACSEYLRRNGTERPIDASR